MNYGEWTQQEITNARTKAEYYMELHEAVWNEIDKINMNMYRHYVESHTSKFAKFRILAPKVKEPVQYFNQIECVAHKLYEKNLLVYVIHGDYYKKYDVNISTNELRFMNFFLLNVAYQKTYKECQSFIKRLQYCIGGEVGVDDVYLLCDIDIGIKLLEEELKHFNNEKQVL
ncbi:hypothetical protein XaC1_153 [Xanthomonas phage XaC1]|nr:hypothetical protein XaC1_153 [Xanthomonas phage XaC1]